MDLFTKTIFFWLGLLVLVPWIPPCSRRHLVRLMHLQLGMLKNDGVFGPWSVITAQTLETTHTLSIFERMNRTLEKKMLPKFFQLGPQYQIWSEKTWFFPNHQIEARPVGPPHLPPFGNLSCKGCSICLTCKRGRFQ